MPRDATGRTGPEAVNTPQFWPLAHQRKLGVIRVEFPEGLFLHGLFWGQSHGRRLNFWILLHVAHEVKDNKDNATKICWYDRLSWAAQYLLENLSGSDRRMIADTSGIEGIGGGDVC